MMNDQRSKRVFSTYYRPIKRERDNQRAKLYKADDVLEKFNPPKLTTVPEVEKFVKALWKRKRLRTKYPRAFGIYPPRVKDGRGCRSAWGNASALTFPLWARTTNVILHELAHCITDRECGALTAGHGWQFCSVYLVLVREIMGKEAHDALKSSFREHRVKFRQPKKRKPLSPERRQALIETLAAARAKRD